MSMNSEEQERIDCEAAEWWVEKDEGMSHARNRQFLAWSRRDPRHAQAFARLEQTKELFADLPLIRAEVQPTIPFPASARSEGGRTRSRRVPGWAFLGLAAAVAAVLALSRPWARERPPATHYQTTSNGYERVVLADGSVMELNAKTDAVVQYLASERRILLAAGEAHFNVAHDTARPFVVRAGDVSVKAVGTSFDVRLATAGTEVLVTEGTVRLATTAAGGAADPARLANLHPDANGNPSLLHAYERVIVPNAPADPAARRPARPVVEKVSAEVVHAALAWQERKLVFTDTPLREVVAQFNSCNRLQLVVADASLADLPVGGTFAADNPEGFVSLLARGKVVAVERQGDWELVLRDAR